jgi:hypothetical protein
VDLLFQLTLFVLLFVLLLFLLFRRFWLFCVGLALLSELLETLGRLSAAEGEVGLESEGLGLEKGALAFLPVAQLQGLLLELGAQVFVL